MTILALKWRSESLEFEFDRETMTASELGSLISAKTGIPVERITLMIPGWSLKKFNNVKDGSLMKDYTPNQENFKGTLMGTPLGEEFNPPETSATDQESGAIPEAAAAAAGPPMRRGYVNLGNTCYMNSILALLECCTKFVTAVKTEQSIRSNQLGRAWQSLWSMKDPMRSINPRPLFEELCKAHPAFAARAAGNQLLNQQQDADECLTVLTNNLPNDCDWKAHFRFKLKQEICLADEASSSASPSSPTVSEEETLKLNCYPGTYANRVVDVSAGLRLSFKENLDIDGVSHVRCAKITGQLPEYMIIHIVRFEWKKANDLARTAACRAKILRRIAYPEVLDIYEFCDDELKEVLEVGRGSDEPVISAGGADEELPAASSANNYEDRIADGTYGIKAVVTHRGRTVEDGHYICWVWNSDDKQWVKLDDDKSSLVDGSKIDLQGGLADGHVPYILLYERRGQFIA